MKIYLKYVSLVYIKYFFILFVALECFYVGIDILLNLKDLPSSANLILLYVGFTAMSGVGYILPLSLIFALILEFFNMIRNNELISFYALGLSKFSLLKGPFFISLIITLFFIYLNTTSFVYSNGYRDNLENLNMVGKVSNGVFLKYEDTYLYIKEFNAVAKVAKDINIIKIKDSKVQNLSHAKSATYDNEKWTFFDDEGIILPLDLTIGKDGFARFKRSKFESLYGFDPSSIEKVYDNSNVYSIKDALKAIKSFKNQGVNISSIKSALYSLVFSPFFASIMLVILFYHFPVTNRFHNLAILSFIFFIVTLLIWGTIFVLTRFCITGVIVPEIGIILPIILLGLYAVSLVFRNI